METNYRIPSLDGWRGISILIVLFGHEIVDGTMFGIGRNNRWEYFFAWHPYGVQIFFVISGYIITQLMIREESKNGIISIRNFYKRRFFRIIPALFTFLLVLFFLHLKFKNETIKPIVWLLSLFFLANFTFLGQSWSTGHLWSLSVEEQYYLFWPMIFYTRRFRIIIPFIFVIISPFLRIVQYKYPGSIDPFSFFTHADAIFIGALFAFYDKKKHLRIGKIHKIIIYTLTLFCLLSQKILIPHAGIISVPFSNTLFSLSTIILIKRSFDSSTFLFKLLNSKSLVLIGKMSYSIYLWQQLFYPPSIFGNITITHFPFNFLLTFMIAYFSYRFVEKPVLAWHKMKLNVVSNQ
jgi:peptidoglycan/LPS O-acetylase OafA/YrhL